MRNIAKYFLVALLGVYVFGSVLTRPAMAQITMNTDQLAKGAAWFKRCDEPKDKANENSEKYCEIYHRLSIKETKQRFVEFALGYPRGKDKARGIVVLPLGILLTSGVEMKIDDHQMFQFDPRFCDGRGCFAYVELSHALVEMMKKGNEIIISFWSKDSQKINVPISLKGFTKALEDIQ